MERLKADNGDRQARSKQKITRGGGAAAERVARINSPPPPPRFNPSVKACFLVHIRSLQLCTIPLVLSLIFHLC